MKLFHFFFLFITLQLSYAQISTMDHDSLYQKAANFIKQNKHEEALKIALPQIEKKEQIPAKKAQWLVLISDIFYKKKEYEKALGYNKKAFKINLELNDSLALMQDHIKIGAKFHFIYNKNFDKRFKKEIARLLDSAFYYNGKNLNEYKNVKKGLFYKAQSHSNISYILSDIDSLEKAHYHIDKAIEIYKEQLPKDIKSLNKVLINKGLIYIYQKRYNEAIKAHLEVYNKIVDTSDSDLILNKLRAISNLSYIYEQKKNYKKAYEYQEEYNSLYEILQEKQRANEIIRIEAIHNEEKARAEEKINTEKQREEKERIKLQFTVFGLIAVSIFLLGTILYRNSKLKQKNLSLKLVKQELAQEQELKLLQEQNQNKVLNATLDGREKERKDIAQTLHDSVSALLSSANLHLQVIKKKSPEGITEIEKSQRIIDEASDKVRDLSHKLISAVLLKFGLEHAIYDMCEKYSNDVLLFELDSEEKLPRFEQDFEIKIHNIVEEFINNIIKHSKATAATIKLQFQNNTLHIHINDNGIGFNTAKINPKAGIGLSQIKARIESLEGSLDIQSSHNNGTTITIEVPVIKHN